MPAGTVDSKAPLSVSRYLDIPKSAIFACSFSFNRMLDDFRSLWTIGGLHPLCRYSNPEILNKKKESQILKIFDPKLIYNNVEDQLNF